MSSCNLQTLGRMVIFWGVLLLAACSHLDPVERNAKGFETWRESESGYRFMPGDELDVKVIYNPELSDRVIVAPDGLIYLELIGAVPVMGKTPEAVAVRYPARAHGRSGCPVANRDSLGEAKARVGCPQPSILPIRQAGRQIPNSENSASKKQPCPGRQSTENSQVSPTWRSRKGNGRALRV